MTPDLPGKATFMDGWAFAEVKVILEEFRREVAHIT